MKLSENIKKYRTERGLTQKDLSNALELEPATISKYESGVITPSLDVLKKLADYFEISIDDMVKSEDEKFNPEKIDILKVLRDQKDMKLSGNIYHASQILFAYNTNRIEGSKLTEEQTRHIFDTNSIILTDKSEIINIDDITETLNHFKAVDYMLDIADKKLTEKIIKKIHEILKNNTRNEITKPGEYKKYPNEVSNIKTTSPKFIEKEMKDLLKKYNSIKEVKIEDIIDFHFSFERIHPFQDGNGRVGRIIMFKECLKHGIIPFIILDKDKLLYYRGLNEYKTEKGYLIDTCLNAQDQYKSMMKRYLYI